ncbi:MAG: hypothetical protein ACTS3F_02025 [Phycisphaerales bacterium]
MSHESVLGQRFVRLVCASLLAVLVSMATMTCEAEDPVAEVEVGEVSLDHLEAMIPEELAEHETIVQLLEFIREDLRSLLSAPEEREGIESLAELSRIQLARIESIPEAITVDGSSAGDSDPRVHRFDFFGARYEFVDWANAMSMTFVSGDFVSGDLDADRVSQMVIMSPSRDPANHKLSRVMMGTGDYAMSDQILGYAWHNDEFAAPIRERAPSAVVSLVEAYSRMPLRIFQSNLYYWLQPLTEGGERSDRDADSVARSIFIWHTIQRSTALARASFRPAADEHGDMHWWIADRTVEQGEIYNSGRPVGLGSLACVRWGGSQMLEVSVLEFRTVPRPSGTENPGDLIASISAQWSVEDAKARFGIAAGDPIPKALQEVIVGEALATVRPVW